MEKIRVSLIIEIMGRPPEHIKQAIELLLKKMGSDKGINILSQKIHEPKPVENSNDLHTTFAEVDAELDSLEIYFGMIFAYLPAHIEIISPENLSLSNIEFNELGNKLIARLHDYDALAKSAMMQNRVLTKKLQEVAPHLFQKSEAPASASPEQKEKPKQKSKPKAKSKKKK